MGSQTQEERKKPFNLQETKSAIGKFQILMRIINVWLSQCIFSRSSPSKKQVGFFVIVIILVVPLQKNKNQNTNDSITKTIIRTLWEPTSAYS